MSLSACNILFFFLFRSELQFLPSSVLSGCTKTVGPGSLISPWWVSHSISLLTPSKPLFCSKALIVTHITPNRFLTLRVKHESLISNSSFSSVHFSSPISGALSPWVYIELISIDPSWGHQFLCEQNGRSLIWHLLFQHLTQSPEKGLKIYLKDSSL